MLVGHLVHHWDDDAKAGFEHIVEFAEALAHPRLLLRHDAHAFVDDHDDHGDKEKQDGESARLLAAHLLELPDEDGGDDDAYEFWNHGPSCSDWFDLGDLECAAGDIVDEQNLAGGECAFALHLCIPQGVAILY